MIEPQWWQECESNYTYKAAYLRDLPVAAVIWEMNTKPSYIHWMWTRLAHYINCQELTCLAVIPMSTWGKKKWERLTLRQLPLIIYTLLYQTPSYNRCLICKPLQKLVINQSPQVVSMGLNKCFYTANKNCTIQGFPLSWYMMTHYSGLAHELQLWYFWSNGPLIPWWRMRDSLVSQTLHSSYSTG